VYSIVVLRVVREKVGGFMLSGYAAFAMMKDSLIEGNRVAASLADAVPVVMCSALLRLTGIASPGWMLLQAQEGNICDCFERHPKFDRQPFYQFFHRYVNGRSACCAFHIVLRSWPRPCFPMLPVEGTCFG
jgi:hypothetical protein